MKIAIVDSGLGLLYLLKKIIQNDLKHDIHLIFTSIFPLGNYKEKDIIKEVRRIKKKIKEGNYHKVIIMCNTLSCYLKEEKEYTRILDFNEEYLFNNPFTQPIGTKHTINYLKKGYIEKHLAKDIEDNNYNNIVEDVKKWPASKEYLLCCTHYVLVIDLIKNVLPNVSVVDMSDKVFEIIKDLKEDKRLIIDYGSRKEDIIKRL